MATLVFAMLSGMVAYGLVAMPLAMLGWLRPFPTGVAATVVTFLMYVLWTRSLGGVPRPDGPRSASPSLAAGVALLGIIAVTAVNALYASEHLYVDRDPGVYVVTGAWLADEGDLFLEGLQGPFAADEEYGLNGAGFYGGAPDGQIYAQFFHLFPAVLAVGDWIGGEWALLKTNPVVGGLALLAFYALCARFMRPWFAVAATAALATNFVQVYFTRDTYTEVLSQVFLFGGLWALSHARERGNLAAGLFAGLVFGMTSMTRIDAFFYLIPLVAVLAYDLVAARLVQGEERRRRVAVVCGATVGVAVTATLGVIDGYVFARPYFLDLGSQVRMIFLGLGATVLLAIVVVAAAKLIGWLLQQLAPARTSLAVAAGIAVVVLGAYGWLLRPHHPVEDPAQVGTPVGSLVATEQEEEGVPIDEARTYAEETLRRLGFFVGPAALAVGILGTAIASGRVVAGRGDRYVPFLAVFLATFLLYAWRPSITPDLPWAMRRFLPIVIPGIVLMASFFSDALWDVDLRRRWLAWPLRGVALASIAVVVAHPVAYLAPIVDVRTRAAPLPAIMELCDALPEGAAVGLVQNERARLTLPQTLMGLCEVPVATIPADTSAEELRALDARWEDAGRLFHLVSERPEPFPGIGSPEAVIRVDNQQLERTVEEPPRATDYFEHELHVIPID